VTSTTPRTQSWIPSWPMVTTKFLELRKRVGIMITATLLVVGLPVIVLGIRLIVHAANSSSTGPAGSPGVFSSVSTFIASFGFIAAAVLGAAAGTSDLSDGVFRHLVITGRSRVALYFARIPATIAIMTALLAAGFLVVCLVTSFAGTTNPASAQVLSNSSINVPLNLTEPQLGSFIFHNQGQIGFQSATGTLTMTQADAVAQREFSSYQAEVAQNTNPSVKEMIDVGLWLELIMVLGCVVGIGIGSVIGQRTISTILLIVLQILITPIAAISTIPDFIDGQRLIVGVAIDQLRPIVLSGVGLGGGGHHSGGIVSDPAVQGMPHWFMIAVIVGWLVVWTVLGAWRMNRRDA
jgi:ABC-type transport system involved in multi-copper enzyme maturation permease subunit